VTVKVCIDQFIQAPILLAFIILGMGLMQGEGIGELQKDMQKQYTSTLIANCKCWWIPVDMYGGNRVSHCIVSYCTDISSSLHAVLLSLSSLWIPSFVLSFVGKLWIPATTVNIAFIKPTLRVLYDNLVFFIWTIFLSMMLNDWTEEYEMKRIRQQPAQAHHLETAPRRFPYKQWSWDKEGILRFSNILCLLEWISDLGQMLARSIYILKNLYNIRVGKLLLLLSLLIPKTEQEKAHASGALHGNNQKSALYSSSTGAEPETVDSFRNSWPVLLESRSILAICRGGSSTGLLVGLAKLAAIVLACAGKYSEAGIIVPLFFAAALLL
jgi:hypothetical protein